MEKKIIRGGIIMKEQPFDLKQWNCAKSSVGKQKLENLFTYMRNRQFGNAPAFPEAWARKEAGLKENE